MQNFYALSPLELFSILPYAGQSSVVLHEYNPKQTKAKRAKIIITFFILFYFYQLQKYLIVSNIIQKCNLIY